ncbi:MAG: BREX system P-loop protein BrxC [Eubacteriales bacterium]|nr:BREX system P-loop protein BrxC [Eubacteriales bacterium]
MLVREMFKKKIDREIKGVIKVAQNDEENRCQELEEYVVTRELLKHIATFYQNYQKGIDGYTDEMGVWISGFFGSGKSHFLKILSYLLENDEVKGKRAVDFFADKVSDPAVYADIERASRIKCETILFNIDSKSPLGIKNDKAAILKVFLKVFYEHLGYYGDDFKVAELEKYLNREGVLEQFKTDFAKLKGETWEDRRSCFFFDEDAVVEALMRSTGMSESSAGNWFNHSQGPSISIGQFAQEVKQYIDSKGKNFHLVFLVDEVGQYIGDNSELMLNLQTVAEDLGTHCQGKVWVIVTSQEDIDSVTKVKGNDFSKIQGRFKTRLSLSSASVDEVIKKRILEKSDHANDKLRLIYSEQAATLKNLIHFSEGTVADLKGYSGEEEFCSTYPFVPYQFKLLQEVFNQIRRYGASGKHLSEGERSMLSAFQDAACKHADGEVGLLIPFYAFYDSVHEFLDGSIQRVIIRASEAAVNKEGLEHKDLDVLKLLFLIRYIGDIPANIENIATLMVSRINEDKLSLKENIKKSLQRLISQNYVQKNADEYRFLTDDEQDINREIRNTVIDGNVVVQEIGAYIFNDIYEDQKYQYSKRYPLPFNRKIDETSIGNQAARMGLRALTRAADDYDANEAELKMVSAGSNDLIIRLNDGNDYFEEMQEALKIERFDKIKKQTNLPANLKRIMVEKQEEARERKTRAKNMLEDALLQGRYYTNGEIIDPKGSSAKEKMNNGLKVLVESVYNKLFYVREFLDSDQDIENILNKNVEQFTIMAKGEELNQLALDEVMNYIDLQDLKNLQITMKGILDKFEDAPYGWREIDIAGMVASLFKQQKIRLLYQGAFLELTDKAIPGYLRKKTEVEKLLIKKRVNVDEKLIKTAREICKDLFNTVDLPSDEDGLIRQFLAKMQEKTQQIETDYLRHYEDKKYPGKDLIMQGVAIFKEIEQYRQNHLTLLSKLKDYQDELLDWDEDMKMIKGFFKNQRVIFDKGLDMLKRIEDNQSYLQDTKFSSKTAELQAIIKDSVPYKKINQIPDLTGWLDKQFEESLNLKKEYSKTTVQKDYEQLTKVLTWYGLSDEDKKRFNRDINSWYEAKYCYIDDSIGFERLDAAITQSVNYRKHMLYEIEKAIADGQKKPGTHPGEGPAHEPEIHVLELKEIALVDTLCTEEDVDDYVNNLGNKLKGLIKAKKVIRFGRW